MSAVDRTIFLYTSNIRERYVADALAAIALPSGARIRFRYDQKYVSAELQDIWLSAKNSPAIVHLSIQHPQRFHDSALVPLRHAKFVSGTRSGGILIVDLELGDYFAFSGLPVGTEPNKAQRLELGRRIRDYSALLRDDERYPSPDDDVPRSAGVVPTLATIKQDLRAKKLELASDNDAAFRALVDYLSATLTNPERFYYRVAGIRPIDSDKFLSARDGEFWLTTGRSYVVEVFQRQENLAMIPASLAFVVGDGLSSRGLDTLTLTSAYDSFSIVLDVPDRPDVSRSYFEISPPLATQAATVRVNVVLSPSNAQKFAVPAAGAIATGAVALAATDVLPKDGAGAVLSVATAVLVFGLGVWQTKRGLSLLP